MNTFTDNADQKNWTVTEAKARLSELLRLANDKPQYIGAKKSYVLITQEKWQEVSQPKEPMGRWLVAALADSALNELELPSRAEAERDIPFQ